MSQLKTEQDTFFPTGQHRMVLRLQLGGSWLAETYMRALARKGREENGCCMMSCTADNGGQVDHRVGMVKNYYCARGGLRLHESEDFLARRYHGPPS